MCIDTKEAENAHKHTDHAIFTKKNQPISFKVWDQLENFLIHSCTHHPFFNEYCMRVVKKAAELCATECVYVWT